MNWNVGNNLNPILNIRRTYDHIPWANLLRVSQRGVANSGITRPTFWRSNICHFSDKAIFVNKVTNPWQILGIHHSSESLIWPQAMKIEESHFYWTFTIRTGLTYFPIFCHILHSESSDLVIKVIFRVQRDGKAGERMWRDPSLILRLT